MMSRKKKKIPVLVINGVTLPVKSSRESIILKIILSNMKKIKTIVETSPSLAKVTELKLQTSVMKNLKDVIMISPKSNLPSKLTIRLNPLAS